LGSRFMATIVGILGVVVLVFGVIFIIQAGSGDQAISDEIQPLKIEEVNAKYDVVKTKQIAARDLEEPQIQAGKAAPSAVYNYLSAQRALLGVTKTNMALSSFVRYVGIVSLAAGFGLVFIAALLMRKKQTA
jgi:hypothetical protein